MSWDIGGVVADRWEVFGAASGGMGRVYFVRDRAWGGMQLAVKTLRDDDAVSRALFEREAKTWLDLGDHPNIVTGFYTLRLDGALRFFMEFVPGHALEQGIEVPFSRALEIAAQVACGLEFAHARGVVHRDLKPANCLVAEDGAVRVTDFGLGKHVGQREVSSGAAGTPHYMAPEQWRSLGAAGPPADVYAFGVMLYRLVGGGLPFDARTMRELHHLHLEQAPPPLACEPRIAELVLACLEKDPDARPTFATIRAALGARDAPALASTPGGESNRAISYAVMGAVDEALAILDGCDRHALFPWLNASILRDRPAAEVRRALEAEVRPRHAEALAADPALVAFDRALGHRWFAHGGLVEDVAIGPLCDVAITVGSHGLAPRRWDVASGALEAELPGTRWTRVAYTAGRHALGGMYGDLEVRRADGTVLHATRHAFGQVRHLGFAGRHRLIVGADQLAIVDVDSGAVVAARPGCSYLAHDDTQVIAHEHDRAIALDLDGSVRWRGSPAHAAALDGGLLATGHDGVAWWNGAALPGAFVGRVVELAVDGRFVAASSDGGTTRAYADGVELLALQGERAVGLAWGANGNLILVHRNATGGDGIVEIRDLTTRVRREVLRGPVERLALSVDRKLFALATGSHARMFEVYPRAIGRFPLVVHRRIGATQRRESLRERDAILARLAADDVSAYDDARRIQRDDPHLADDAALLRAIDALGERKGTAIGIRGARRAWTVATAEDVLLSVAVSRDRIATGGRAGRIAFVDAGGQPIASGQQTAWTTSLAFSPDGAHLASADGDGIGVWTRDGGFIRRIDAPAPVVAVGWRGDRIVAVCGVVAMFALDGELLARVDVGPAPRGLQIADRLAIVGDGDAPFLAIVDFEIGAARCVDADHTPRVLAFAPPWLVTSPGLGGELALWDLETLAIRGSTRGGDHVNHLAVDRGYLAIATSSNAVVMALETGDIAATLPGQDGAAAIAFAPNGGVVTVFRGDLTRWDLDRAWRFA